jgi:hypothetical protein
MGNEAVTNNENEGNQQLRMHILFDFHGVKHSKSEGETKGSKS